MLVTGPEVLLGAPGAGPALQMAFFTQERWPPGAGSPEELCSWPSSQFFSLTLFLLEDRFCKPSWAPAESSCGAAASASTPPSCLLCACLPALSPIFLPRAQPVPTASPRPLAPEQRPDRGLRSMALGSSNDQTGQPDGGRVAGRPGLHWACGLPLPLPHGPASALPDPGACLLSPAQGSRFVLEDTGP